MTRGQPARFATVQAGLGLPPAPVSWDQLARGAENSAALDTCTRPGSWATPALCVTGPARCGLTTLARLAAARLGGAFVEAGSMARLSRKRVSTWASGFVALDDADLAADDAAEMVLSLLNSASAANGHVLLTSHRPPPRWATASPDLRSRLKALPVIDIAPPGEALARDWLKALAAQRYMRLSPETLNYLVPRLDLHYEAVENLIDRLNDAVTESGRAPGIALVRQVLDGVAEPDGDDPPADPDEG